MYFGIFSALVTTPDTSGPVRGYHLMAADHAVSSIAMRRLKVARFSEVNDPFELLGLNIMKRELRPELARFRELENKATGLLCFSEDWKNSVLWSHYGAGGRGICLGFDINPRLGRRGIKRVQYSDSKLQAVNPGVISDELKELLLVTKFEHWRYEREIRVFVDLEQAEREGSLHFWPFSEDLQLVQVFLGHLCPDSLLKAIRRLTSELYSGVQVTKARLGLKHFKVKEDGNYRPPPVD